MGLATVGRLQRPVRAFVAPALRAFLRLEVVGADRVPRSGPLVLAPKHDSMWDVPLLVVACPRPITFMALAEVMGTPLKNRVLTELGGFPVRRGSRDVAALRAALAVLRAGRALGVFPESTRGGGRLLPFRTGAAWLALQSGAPLVPVGIAGSADIWRPPLPRRARVRIEFGDPIPVDRDPGARRRSARAAELTEQLRSAVERLS